MRSLFIVFVIISASIVYCISKIEVEKITYTVKEKVTYLESCGEATCTAFAFITDRGFYSVDAATFYKFNVNQSFQTEVISKDTNIYFIAMIIIIAIVLIGILTRILV